MDLDERRWSLPVFPLPRVVLMPGATLPLHVFEPRYRELLADVVAADGLMGIATLKSGYEADYEGKPPIHPEIGIGRVLQRVELPDGRSNLLLEHVASARVVSELTSRPYRRFATELTDGAPPVDAELAGVRGLVLQLAASAPDASVEAARLASLPPLELTHAVARRMFTSPELQRAYLGADHTLRVRWVSEGLAELLGARAPIGDA